MIGLVIILVLAALVGGAWWWMAGHSADGQKADSFPDRDDRR
jgi:hypothetical protein